MTAARHRWVRGGNRRWLRHRWNLQDGRIVYELRADFGIEPDALYERYAFYLDAYPQIRREVR